MGGAGAAAGGAEGRDTSWSRRSRGRRGGRRETTSILEMPSTPCPLQRNRVISIRRDLIASDPTPCPGPVPKPRLRPEQLRNPPLRTHKQLIALPNLRSQLLGTLPRRPCLQVRGMARGGSDTRNLENRDQLAPPPLALTSASSSFSLKVSEESPSLEGMAVRGSKPAAIDRDDFVAAPERASLAMDALSAVT